MAKLKCKGTLFKLEISMAMTTIAQCIELDVAQDQMETYDADTLDNTDAYIPKEPTGRSSAGDITGTLFYDPALANHQFITDTIAAPAKVDGEILLSDASSKHEFEAAGLGMGLSVRMNDGLKAPFTVIKNTTSWPT